MRPLIERLQSRKFIIAIGGSNYCRLEVYFSDLRLMLFGSSLAA